MIRVDDIKTLLKIVGQTTLERGLIYASQGRVEQLVLDEDGDRAASYVRGTRREPYYVVVTIDRSPLGELKSFAGECTCPVAVNCKHAVALLLTIASVADGLASGRLRPPSSRDEPPSSRAGLSLFVDDSHGSDLSTKAADGQPMTWEASLRGLVSTSDTRLPGQQWGSDRPDPVVNAVGLQFEVVFHNSHSTIGKGEQTARISVRPVTRSHTGNWIRQGISWSRLDSLLYRPQASSRTKEQIYLMKELLALSYLGDHNFGYGYRDEVIWLETINSRRIWNLLEEASEVHLPLVTAAKGALPVNLYSQPVTVGVDVRRVSSDLNLEPYLDSGSRRISLSSCLAIGVPAHGIAWWRRSDHLVAVQEIHLAALDCPLDRSLKEFLSHESILVPAVHTDRFFDEFYPSLQRMIFTESSDGSVELPEPAPAAILLTLCHLGDHRVSLTWERSSAKGELHADLWSGSSFGRERAAEDVIIKSVVAIVGSVPELIEVTSLGPRLVQQVVIEGISAVRFITDLLPILLEEPGVKVDVVGIAPDYREILSAPIVSFDGKESEDNDWLDLSVHVSVDGEEVIFADLFVAIAEEQSHMILPSGAFFSLDRDELRELAKLISEARSLQEVSHDGIRLSRFQASLWEELMRLGVVTAQASKWEASVRALSESHNRTEHSVPNALNAKLRPYQLTGFNWLAFLCELGLGGILADDMGLGKTLQALALICHTKEQARATDSTLTQAPYLVVAPTSVVGNWVSECRRFAPSLNCVAVGETAKRREISLAELANGTDVVVTSYSLFRLEYDDYAAIEWTGLFLDEAQFVKNRHSQGFQRAKMLPVSFKVAMTGTPIENNLMELWSLLSITAPGLYANPERFSEYYRIPIEKNSNSERLAQLRRRVRPLMLRRTKEEVAEDLPEKQEQILELDLVPRHKKLYQTYLQRERQKVLGLIGDLNKHRFEIFRSLTLLRQASLDMSLVDSKHARVPSTKLDAMMEMLEDIVADGHRVLVFSQFTRFLDLARQRIESAGIEYCYLDGKTRKREIVISDFREGVAPVFLISLKAGGFGLNLTEADYCIILDPWWNPATEAQAVDRVHRIGQTKNVMVYRLVAKETIEEKVMALKARKASLFANVMDGGEFESGALTADDIRDLLD